MLKVVQSEGVEESAGSPAGSLLDELIRDGARQMLAAALQAEVAAYVDQFADVVDERGASAGGPERFPKAVAKIVDELDVLLEFYNYPAEHWVHLRTTNPIATVRHRTKVTKGPGSRVAGLAMAFKLIEAAGLRWRAVNAAQLVALVRAGATFRHGKLVARSDGDIDAQAVA